MRRLRTCYVLSWFFPHTVLELENTAKCPLSCLLILPPQHSEGIVCSTSCGSDPTLTDRAVKSNNPASDRWKTPKP